MRRYEGRKLVGAMTEREPVLISQLVKIQVFEDLFFIYLFIYIPYFFIYLSGELFSGFIILCVGSSERRAALPSDVNTPTGKKRVFPPILSRYPFSIFIFLSFSGRRNAHKNRNITPFPLPPPKGHGIKG
jgi:hypothetical protein